MLRDIMEMKKRQNDGLCPSCGKPVSENDFTDPLDLKEFHISGFCKECQDEVFG